MTPELSESPDALEELRAENERLRQELAEWQKRYHDLLQEHEFPDDL